MPVGCAEAVLLGPVAEPVDPELARHLEEERVARVAEPAIDVAGSEPAAVPVVEPRRAERQVAPRLDLRRVGDLLVGEDAGAGDELVGRARRVVRLDRVVESAACRVVEELRVVRVADPAREHGCCRRSGRLTIARTSPVCGFMTMTTPRFIPTSFIAHFSAFWAYCCSFVSIVSVSESPGRALGDGLEDLRAAAGGIPLDALAPVRRRAARVS